MSYGESKTATELAARCKREAYIERRCKPSPVLSNMWERHAGEIVALPQAPDIGPGGEVVRTQPLPELHATKVKASSDRFGIRDTLSEGATRIAEDASIQRTDLLLQTSFDCVAMGIDAAESIGAENSLEKMLAHQMAVAHQMAMTFADRALSHQQPRDQVEACRCANTSARLMSVFQDGMLTLQRIRSGGNQTVTVQHVTVAQGGQAVIGNVGTGGSRRGGSKSKNG